MRRAAWGGAPSPVDRSEAKQRIVEAAWRCVARTGLERMNVADIAAEAGVTRQTVYRHFASRSEIPQAVIAMAAGDIVERMFAQARRFPRPGDRLVEAMVFLRREIPKDPHMGSIFGAQGAASPEALQLSETVLGVGRNALRTLNEEWAPLSSRDVDDLAELILRLLRSFITDPGPKPLGDVAFRSFLYRWLIPATGLPTRASRSHPARPRVVLRVAASATR